MSKSVTWDQDAIVTYVIDDNGNKRMVEKSFQDFWEEINDNPLYVRLVKVDVTVDLTAAGATFVNAFTLPAKAVVKYAAAKILTTVVAGGTGVKVGIGQHTGGTTNLYGHTADLIAGTKIYSLFNVVTPIAADSAIDVNIVTTAGTAMGDTNITAGSVRVVFLYEIPVTLV